MNITLNVDNTLGYSFINGRLKVFVNKGTVSESQESNTSDTQATESSDNPDISQAEEITYYEAINKDLNNPNAEETDSSSREAFYQMWKQGNNYYIKLNPNIGSDSITFLISQDDFYLTPYFEYSKNSSATSIKNIKPIVFDSNKKMIEKGQIELT